MTTPTVTPSKAKALWALIGSLLTLAIPIALQLSTNLPPQYQAVIGGVVALATMLGVYKAPYKPAGTVLVPDSAPAAPAAPTVPPVVTSWPNPWQR